MSSVIKYINLSNHEQMLLKVETAKRNIYDNLHKEHQNIKKKLDNLILFGLQCYFFLVFNCVSSSTVRNFHCTHMNKSIYDIDKLFTFYIKNNIFKSQKDFSNDNHNYNVLHNKRNGKVSDKLPLLLHMVPCDVILIELICLPLRRAN